jgi:hypothetical protein
VRVLLCGGLLVLLLVGGEPHLPLLVRGRLPVLVGARLLLQVLLQKQADIGLLFVVLPLRLLLLMLSLLLEVVVVVRLLVGG